MASVSPAQPPSAAEGTGYSHQYHPIVAAQPQSSSPSDQAAPKLILSRMNEVPVGYVQLPPPAAQSSGQPLPPQNIQQSQPASEQMPSQLQQPQQRSQTQPQPSSQAQHHQSGYLPPPHNVAGPGSNQQLPTPPRVTSPADAYSNAANVEYYRQQQAQFAQMAQLRAQAQAYTHTAMVPPGMGMPGMNMGAYAVPQGLHHGMAQGMQGMPQQLMTGQLSPHAPGAPPTSGFQPVMYGYGPPPMGADHAAMATALYQQQHAQAALAAQQHAAHVQASTAGVSAQVTSPRTRGMARKHECSICGKAFARPSALRTHVYTHTGEKPFQCTEKGCSRSFSVLSNLRRHQRVHQQFH